MRERDYYPLGACDDSQAPYNEISLPEKKFDVCIYQTLRKDTTVETDDFEAEFYDAEDGYVKVSTQYTNWDMAYQDCHMDIVDLLRELKRFVEDEIKVTDESSNRMKRLKYLLEECQGWILEDTSIEEEC